MGKGGTGAGSVVVVALLAAVPYINSLHGKFAYDDKVAVIGNPDVVVHSIPWGDLMKHECVLDFLEWR
jgi:hypothetical protein